MEQINGTGLSLSSPFRKVWFRGWSVHPLLWDLGPQVPLAAVDCNPPLFRRHTHHTLGKKCMITVDSV